MCEVCARSQGADLAQRPTLLRLWLLRMSIPTLLLYASGDDSQPRTTWIRESRCLQDSTGVHHDHLTSNAQAQLHHLGLGHVERASSP